MIVFASILVDVGCSRSCCSPQRARYGYLIPRYWHWRGAAVGVAPIEVIGLRLDPELALALLIAPVLLNTAYDTSLRDTVPVASLARSRSA